jgi:hypothetical protein
MPVYQPLIPTGKVALSLDYKNLQDNFQALDTVFGVDHLPFSNVSAQAGYHTDIHMNPVSTTATNMPNNVPVSNVPAAVPGFGQIFSAQINDGYSADNVLFWKTGGGLRSQLTANFAPVTSGFAGMTYLPGPGPNASNSGTVMMQWGFVSGTHGGDNHFNGGDTASVTFATAFPNRAISIWTQLEYTTGNAPSSTNSASIVIDSAYSKTAFTWKFNTNISVSYTGFLWIAIGT